jgi:hypothetical protein
VTEYRHSDASPRRDAREESVLSPGTTVAAEPPLLLNGVFRLKNNAVRVESYLYQVYLMKKEALLLSFVFIFALNIFSDDLVDGLKKEFDAAGVDLRLDRDEMLRASLKIFDGFIKNPERAYTCGIRTINGDRFTEGTIVFFQIRPDGELRQIFQGHVVMKRRYRSHNPEDKPGWKTLVSSVDRLSGVRLCAEQDKSIKKNGK